MLDLAPNHKQGFPVENPVLLAAGTIGYGDTLPPGMDLSRIGAVVVGPVLYSSRRGSPYPRYAETNGGFVLETGLQNRGIRTVLRRYARKWPTLGCPVIVQLVGTDLREMGRMAEELAEAGCVQGLEVLVERGNIEQGAAVVQRVADYSGLPVFVKLPLDVATDELHVYLDAGAAGFVMGQPLRATLPRSIPNRGTVKDGGSHRSNESRESYVTGNLYGPLTFALMLSALRQIARHEYGCSLIACGGIHTADQAKQALQAGAVAMQIDSAVWVEPSLPSWILAELRCE